MEFAVDANGVRVHANDAVEGIKYFCPTCGEEVRPKQGDIVMWHFAHITPCADSWSYEMSAWHRSWQARFPEECREVVIEHNGVKHRADVCVGKYVIEFQHSGMTKAEFEARNSFYVGAGYKVVWVLDVLTEFEVNRISLVHGGDDLWTWSHAPFYFRSVIPQTSTDVAIVLHLGDASVSEDPDDEDWLVKVSWSSRNGGGIGEANYSRFYLDEHFAVDLFSEPGLAQLMMTTRQRIDAHLIAKKPWVQKCSQMRGNPREWYTCPRTSDWHRGACERCGHCVLTEYHRERRSRAGAGARKSGLYFYCAFPRVVSPSGDVPYEVT